MPISQLHLLLLAYPDAPWCWRKLSAKVSFISVLTYPEKDWDWLELILRFPQHIKDHPELPWPFIFRQDTQTKNTRRKFKPPQPLTFSFLGHHHRIIKIPNYREIKAVINEYSIMLRDMKPIFSYISEANFVHADASSTILRVWRRYKQRRRRYWLRVLMALEYKGVGLDLPMELLVSVVSKI